MTLLPSRAVLTFLCAAATFSACRSTPAPETRPEPARENVPPSAPEPPATLALPTFDSAWTIIARTHWDTTYNGVNWRALRDSLRPRAEAAKTRAELRSVLQQMVGALKQSHFSIIPQEVSDVVESASTNAQSSREGHVGLTVRWLNSQLVVTHVDSSGPAFAAGVRPGWLIRRIGSDSIEARFRRVPLDLDPRRVALAAFSQADGALRGAPGTAASATFVDGAQREQTLSMTRVAVPGTSVKFGNLPAMMSNLDWERRTESGKTIGIIRFNIWMPVLAREFDVAMDSLRSSDAIILDIRGNFGGVAGMSMGFAGHFVDTVIPVGIMKTRAQDVKFAINPRRVNTANERVSPFDGPMAIVVDELSVSTSEIFAGGLQSLGRARIVGSRTAGQALPAVAERLPNGDILYHAIADFLSPGGGRAEGGGVTPDESISLTRDAFLRGGDPALDAALRWAATAPKPPRVTGPRITP